MTHDRKCKNQLVWGDKLYEFQDVAIPKTKNFNFGL